MNPSSDADPFAPEARAQPLILLCALVSGLLLLIAHEAIRDEAQWFTSPRLMTQWFTFAIALPLFAALTVQRVPDRRHIAGIAIYAVVLGVLARHTAAALAPEQVAADSVVAPYILVVLASGYVITAWFAVALTRQGYGYRLLFESAWRLLATLIQVGAYTGAFWLLLMLWAALFKALGIGFFEELFRSTRFIYPVTSLVVGYGLVLARTRSSIGDAVHLRILALWRGLLPLAALLALAFAAALLMQGVEPLWKTRTATALLLSLIVALVMLTNAAYGKGDETPPRVVIKRMVEAALLLLPLYAGLAVWALSLRWDQYGVSVDRLWAALCIAVASVYALGYAYAAVRRRSGWLDDIAWVNRFASLVTATALLLTQTPLLDFRAITANALLARGDALKLDELRYLRWELGLDGVAALEQLQAGADPARAAHITALLGQKERWEQIGTAIDGPRELRRPAGAAALPPGLEDFVLQADRQSTACIAPDECWLLQADVIPGDEAEWLRVRVPPQPADSDSAESIETLLIGRCADGWCSLSSHSHWLSLDELRELRVAIEAGDYQAVTPKRSDLQIGNIRLDLSE